MPAVLMILAIPFLGLCVVFVWRAVRRPRVMRGGCCGKCRYELATLAGGAYPECGSDLLRVGVTGERPEQGVGSFIAGVIGWSMLVFVAAAWLQPIADNLCHGTPLGPIVRMSESFTISPAVAFSADRGPIIDRPYEIDLSTEFTGVYGAAVRSGTVEAEITSPDGIADVVIEIPGVEWALTKSDGSIEQGTGIDRALVARMYEDVGLDVDDARRSFEIDQFAHVLTTRATSTRVPMGTGSLGLQRGSPENPGLEQNAGSSTSGGTVRDGLGAVIVGNTAVVAWGIGIALMIWRQRQLNRWLASVSSAEGSM